MLISLKGSDGRSYPNRQLLKIYQELNSERQTRSLLIPFRDGCKCTAGYLPAGDSSCKTSPSQVLAREYTVDARTAAYLLTHFIFAYAIAQPNADSPVFANDKDLASGKKRKMWASRVHSTFMFEYDRWIRCKQHNACAFESQSEFCTSVARVTRVA